MRTWLLFLAIALTFGAFSVLSVPSGDVEAVGAPTDNSTMPDIPDQYHNEIEPPVNYIWQGPTSQSENTTPNVIASFTGPSEQDVLKVTADENWFLDVDINKPGWLYIYEYFPTGEEPEGEWIAYKWQLPRSGLLRLGPFTPASGESEGQHIYRVWFYSDGQWAAGDLNTPQSILIYWSYSKGLPAEQHTEQIAPQPPIAPAKEATFIEKMQESIAKPVALAIGVSILVVIIALGLYLSRSHFKWYKSQHQVSPPDEAAIEATSAGSPLASTSAKIALPNGIEIQLSGSSKIIGRADLARALNLDKLRLISRRHFEVKTKELQFYIEDLGSANGTKLNGVDISGKGPVNLNDNDVIEPAGVILLNFYVT